MIAHLNGQLFNASTLANSLGITVPTVKRYIDFLEEAFLLKSLPPYSMEYVKTIGEIPENVSDRYRNLTSFNWSI